MKINHNNKNENDNTRVNHKDRFNNLNNFINCRIVPCVLEIFSYQIIIM